MYSFNLYSAIEMKTRPELLKSSSPEYTILDILDNIPDILLHVYFVVVNHGDYRLPGTLHAVTNICILIII